MSAGSSAARVRTFIETTYKRLPGLNETDQTIQVALDKLVARGVDRKKLLDFVATVVIASRKPLYPDSDWTHESGNSARALKELPHKVRNWAEKIGEVSNFRRNGVALLDPEMFVASDWSAKCLAAFFPSYSGVPSMGILLKRLPDLLRAYAVFLEAQVSGISATVADLERVSTFEPDLTALLCEYVHQSTQAEHYCYEQVADLLTAAYQADGQERVISAGALRMNRQRYINSDRTPKAVGFELDENQRTLKFLVELHLQVPPEAEL